MKIFTRKLLIRLIIGVVVLLVITEVTLRTVWGFGHTLLFMSSPNFEYIAEPNQHIVRFGNRFDTNEKSMRSKPLSENDHCIVLGFGDSVINGGTLTDQDSLATTIVENELSAKKIRFLNISAGSWAPDNCAAYLKEYGDFGAKLFVLFVSSHDARDNMTFDPTVDHNVSYPSTQPLLAITEVVDRYLMPRISGMLRTDEPPQTDGLMINKGGEVFNPGFQYFKDYTQTHGIPLLVCLHADTDEVRLQQYNAQGQEILDFCSKNSIPVIRGLDIGEAPEDFRDGIHINEHGQNRWGRRLTLAIDSALVSCR